MSLPSIFDWHGIAVSEAHVRGMACSLLMTLSMSSNRLVVAYVMQGHQIRDHHHAHHHANLCFKRYLPVGTS